MLMCLLALNPQASADIYKCVSEDGTVKYSDAPCSDNPQVAFETEESKTFDEIIGEGYPYPEMPLDPSLIKTEDIVAHAKKIGACIIPGEYLNDVRVRRATPPRKSKEKLSYSWDILLYFGPRDTKKYSIKFDYNPFPVKKKGLYIYLMSFVVRKEGSYFDPPSLHNARKFKRTDTGRYKSDIDHHFPIVQYD